MVRPAVMVKTLTFAPNRSERGTALLEAAIAVGLLALIAATGLSAFSRAAIVSQQADARLVALSNAQNAIEDASGPLFLGLVIDEGRAEKTGDGWRVTGTLYQDEQSNGPMALVELLAVADVANGADVTLRTLRAIPR